jgi:hypothetical protein
MVSQPKRLVPIVAHQNEYVVKIDLARNGCEAQVCTQKTKLGHHFIINIIRFVWIMPSSPDHYIFDTLLLGDMFSH